MAAHIFQQWRWRWRVQTSHWRLSTAARVVLAPIWHHPASAVGRTRPTEVGRTQTERQRAGPDYIRKTRRKKAACRRVQTASAASRPLIAPTLVHLPDLRSMSPHTHGCCRRVAAFHLLMLRDPPRLAV